MWTVLTTFIRIFVYSKPFHPKPNTKAESFFRNFLSLKLISNISGSLNDGHILNWLWLACWLLITSAMTKDISRDISKDLELKLQRQIWDILQGVSSRVVYLTNRRSPLSRSHHYAQLGNTFQKHFFCSFFFNIFLLWQWVLEKVPPADSLISVPQVKILQRVRMDRFALIFPDGQKSVSTKELIYTSFER